MAVACTGASEEPTASLMARTLGRDASSRSLMPAVRMLPPDPSRRTEDVSYELGRASRSSTSGRPLVSPTIVSMVTRSDSTSSSTRLMSMLRCV